MQKPFCRTDFWAELRSLNGFCLGTPSRYGASPRLFAARYWVEMETQTDTSDLFNRAMELVRIPTKVIRVPG
jgi:hypothetical protein